MTGITEHSISDTPVAIVDLETTGLRPNGDRIIEVGVVRIEPGAEPIVVLDTLVDPQRRVSGTEIHGITDADVRGAPTFEQVAPMLLDALDGAVLASYNVYFDIRFLQAEPPFLDLPAFPPHICLMYMRPLLDIGRRCSLHDACASAGIDALDGHIAANDAMMASRLWSLYLGRMRELGISQFSHLSKRKSYKFLKSLSALPVEHKSGMRVALRSRTPQAQRTKQPKVVGRRDRVAEYWEALKASLSDLDLSPGEVTYLKSKASALDLDAEEIRWLHARAFSAVLAEVSDDHKISDQEVQLVSGIAGGLRELGWTPGDPIHREPPSGRRAGLLARILGR